MSEEPTIKPKRGRPPRDVSTVKESLSVENMIPAPPLHIEDAKALEWLDWIFTHLPNEMARNFYGGRNHTPRP